MPNKKTRLERLVKKGLNISIDIPDVESWNEMTAKNRYIPKSFEETQKLIRKIFGAKGSRPKKATSPEVFTHEFTRRSFEEVPYIAVRQGHIKRRFEECHEELYSRLYSGFSNPKLTPDEFDTLESEIDDVTPELENDYETDHFILRWTNNSAHAGDNIADSSIVKETGGFLEKAWNKYESSFGRTPYLPNGAIKMDVIFQSIGAIGLASPPDGPIQFDSETWVSDPGVRRPTSAHELFHKLQYAFGFRTKHTPSGDFKWFSEGTASWAEVFVWQRVSGSYKILNLFSNPDYNLYWNSYTALPYWIFFEARQKDSEDDNPISDFLHKYYELDVTTTDPERISYSEVINDDWPENNVYRKVDNFFALFSRCRMFGDWKNSSYGENLYPIILGPDDSNIEPCLAVIEANLRAGDQYMNEGRVSAFGSDYYRLIFEEDSDSENLNLKVNGLETGDFSYYLIWELDGQCKKEDFPSGVTRDFDKSWNINLQEANSLLLIISGRGKGGAYSLTASIT